MKVSVKKGALIKVFLILLGVVVVLFVGYYFLLGEGKYGNQSLDADFPFFTGHKSYIGANNEWGMELFQPVVVDYITKDGGNYLVGQYINSQGKPVNVEIFITGRYEGEQVRDKVGLVDFDGETEDSKITFDELRSAFPIGSQIAIDYFTQWPDKVPTDSGACRVNPEFCGYPSPEGKVTLIGRNEGFIMAAYVSNVLQYTNRIELTEEESNVDPKDAPEGLVEE